FCVKWKNTSAPPTNLIRQFRRTVHERRILDSPRHRNYGLRRVGLRCRTGPTADARMETRRRGAAGSLYTALSDVQAVADLFAQVLCTISENRGLVSWEKFVTYAAAEWYRSRIAFRKHTPRL